jgi:hypothetical protein
MPRGLDLVSDEDLGREIFALWHSYYIQNLPFTINGASVSQITNKQLEQILPGFRDIVSLATFDQDTDDESLTGLEKGLRRCGSGDFTGGGRLFRAHFERRIEAKTGRRRQSAAASKPRPGRRHYLQDVLREIVTANPGIKWGGALNELRRRAELPRDPDKPHIEQVCEVEGVAWLEPGKVARDPLPMKKVKALFYKEADAVRRLRKKAESR